MQEAKASQARVVEMPQPSGDPLERLLVPARQETVLVARRDDRAAAAAQEAMPEAADAQMTELEEHRPGEMVAEMTEDEPRALKRHKVAALTIGGRRVNVFMQAMVAAMIMCASLPSWEVYGHLSGELLDPQLMQECRDRERYNFGNFQVYKRVPRGSGYSCLMTARGTQTGRTRLVARQVVWEARSDYLLYAVSFGGFVPLVDEVTVGDPPPGQE